MSFRILVACRTLLGTSKSLVRVKRFASGRISFELTCGGSARIARCLLLQGDASLDGAGLGLERCGASAASGDGRDVFTLQAGGQLVNVAGGRCAVIRESNGEDGEVVLGNCDNAAEWEMSGNAQLKLVGAPNLCLSQRGLAAGSVDVAAKAAVTASSTANGFSHGARARFDILTYSRI